ncbi:MarR family winged helix-turn-helix transcriptional regulator [Kibdelosporangium aridum]|nr:MarR family transcriptional regulator [Kibdelosporangium aridum]
MGTVRHLADSEVPGELASLVWSLHRTLLRAKKPPEGQKIRPQSQVELLQLVNDQPGVSVREAAEALRMQPNNVSSLASLLVRDGFLRRVTDPADRRIVRLKPTAKMRKAGSQVDSELQRDIAAALAELPAASAKRIQAAIPDLWALVEQLTPDR